MAIIGTLDLGAHPTWNTPLQTFTNAEWGTDTSSAVIQQFQTIEFPTAGKVRTRIEKIWVRDPAESPTGVTTLVRQLMELAGNPGLQPVPILWKSGGGTIVPDVEDGWYIIKSLKPDFENFFSGMVPVDINATYVAPLPPNAHAMAAFGGLGFTSQIAAPAPYSANLMGNMSWIAFHPNATVDNSFTRISADGNIPILLSVPSSITQPPAIFSPSATLADWFKGRPRILDTINTSSNPVPTTGAYINSNWLEIFQNDHKFTGDTVITNGLLLLLIQANTTHVATVYWWNINTVQWQQIGTLDSYDLTGALANNRGIQLYRQSWDEVAFRIFSVGNNGNQTYNFFRLQRGAPFVRVASASMNWGPTFNISVATAGINQGLFLALNSAVAFKSIATDVILADPTLDPIFANMTSKFYGSLAFSPYFMISASGINNTFPYIVTYAFMATNNTGNAYPTPYFGSTTLFSYPTRANPGVTYTWVYYSLGITPLSSPSSYQAECENGTLTGSMVSTADGAASNGNAAKLPSGTASGNNSTITVFPANFKPPAGTYRIGVRCRASGVATNNVEVKAQFLFNGAPIDTTLGFGKVAWPSGLPTATPTTYTGTVSSGYGGNAGQISLVAGIDGTFVDGATNVQIRITNTGSQITGNASVDYFFDEIFLLPDHLTTAYNGPSDISQQFNFDRTTKFIPF